MSARRPAVAGTFYPDDPTTLTRTVDHLLDDARIHPALADTPPTRVVVAPHAGYAYSGPVAAVAHRALPTDAQRVAIVGPAHRVRLRGVALPATDRWATPLGETVVDLPAALHDQPGVVVDETPHAPEHSLEVHVPFVQHLLPHARIAPVLVGGADEHLVADVLATLLDDPGTVVVVSSDLSHYLPYEQAARVDRATLDQVTALDGRLAYEQACGADPLSGLMEHARRTRTGLRELASCSSGDTAGDRTRVVGYAALALTGTAPRTWAPAGPGCGAPR